MGSKRSATCKDNMLECCMVLVFVCATKGVVLNCSLQGGAYLDNRPAVRFLAIWSRLVDHFEFGECSHAESPAR